MLYLVALFQFLVLYTYAQPPPGPPSNHTFIGQRVCSTDSTPAQQCFVDSPQARVLQYGPYKTIDKTHCADVCDRAGYKLSGIENSSWFLSCYCDNELNPKAQKAPLAECGSIGAENRLLVYPFSCQGNLNNSNTCFVLIILINLITI